jgi:orotate phosphoribosyltransferase
MTDIQTERQIAGDLLEIGAVTFASAAPFIWASGLLSPIYCDNRMTMGYPDVRRRIRDAFVDRIRREELRPDLIAGTATAGIPHAAWLAESLDLPMIYVRSKSKGHGKESAIEGPVKEGQRVVVVEDLVSTGGSSVGVVRALSSEKLGVVAVLAIFSYQLQESEQAFSEIGVPLFTLTNFGHLLDVAASAGKLDDRGAESLAAWRTDPWQWTRDRREKEGSG